MTDFSLNRIGLILRYIANWGQFQNYPTGTPYGRKIADFRIVLTTHALYVQGKQITVR